MNVTVVGAGYVGLVTAACLAEVVTKSTVAPGTTQRERIVIREQGFQYHAIGR
jgi:UDP-glucose 6-dehydrogenase